jgi:hypothetical protein
VTTWISPRGQFVKMTVTSMHISNQANLRGPNIPLARHPATPAVSAAPATGAGAARCGAAGRTARPGLLAGGPGHYASASPIGGAERPCPYCN